MDLSTVTAVLSTVNMILSTVTADLSTVTTILSPVTVYLSTVSPDLEVQQVSLLNCWNSYLIVTAIIALSQIVYSPPLEDDATAAPDMAAIEAACCACISVSMVVERLV